MTKKMIFGLMSLALTLTGVTGVTGAYCGWFRTEVKPVVSSSSSGDKEAIEAAARHCRCQPRHWRYLMLQQQQ